jgi:predicted dehydrogenase
MQQNQQDFLSSSRRSFITRAGKGLLAAGFAPALFSDNKDYSVAAENAGVSVQDTTPVKLSPLNAPSEKQSPPPPAPFDPSKKIGFAIVGLGHLSLENILPAFAKSKFAKPVALVSGDAGKAAIVASQYGIKSSSIYNYKNYDQIKDNKEIEALYIVLPNSMHAEFTIRAANAGKHVLCEKPMANTVLEAQSMIAACKKAGKKLMIAYRVQYEPHHHLVREFVQNGEYGKTKLMEMFNSQNIGDPEQWRLKKALAGGGSLPDIGIYCLNTARYLTGLEPEWLLASLYTSPGDIRFKEVEETVFFQLRFPSGMIANCGCSYGVHESRRYRCLADKGAWFGMDPAFPYTGLKIEMSEVKNNKDWQQVPGLEEKDQFTLELDHMAQCILNDKTPYTPGEEGLQDHVIMEAIYRSAKEGKPVELKAGNQKDMYRGTVPGYD